VGVGVGVVLGLAGTVGLGVAAALGLPDRVARKALATAMAATARAAPTLIVHRRICRFR
jgi:hypothetical protein